MKNVLIFAGTEEGRTLAENLTGLGISVHICVATEYGEKLLPKEGEVSITSKRLNMADMKNLMLDRRSSVVIDATHPYAVEASKNIKQACVEMDTECLRIVRASIQEQLEDSLYVESIDEAVRYLKATEGNVLVATGSKELFKFTDIPEYQTRIYARVLSTPKVVEACSELGFEGRNLICMQGPFSEELNYAMLKQIDAKYLVTKESGSVGGFAEKMNAARSAGVKSIVIGRPIEEKGFTYEECLSILRDRFQIKAKRKVVLLGIGMGSYENMTMECIDACRNADVLIGAKRMIDAVRRFNKPTFVSFRTEEIRSFLKNHPEYRNIAIALSGDTGFYSGAAKLIDALKDYEVEVIPGISSVVYLCSKLQMPWQDAKLISNHGRYENMIAAVKTNAKVYSLLGGKDCISQLCKKLLYYGLKDVVFYLGEQLSYENEKITIGSPEKLLNMDFMEPCAVLIENKDAKCAVMTHGLSDESFIRGQVPMTKEEVRSISISKLKLTKDAVVYDIGAGTGSVSIETALQSVDGKIYAIEKNREAVGLIEENKRRFGTDNLVVIEGTAPKAMEELPAPTHAFIGGSSGNLEDIVKQLLDKNPNIRIVINSVTLETISEALECLKKLETSEPEVVQAAISKSQKIGDYHMMKGQNPVYIISFTGRKI